MDDDDPMVVYFRLCKSGYATSIREARELTAREVLQALCFDRFCSEYDAAFVELNKS